ncbi:MAG: hypothetical protein NWF03_08580 [Candidatus Bathyarchaeota archaeon]|nr:hypothetical protein [Candidatus Bathyarchaeota archaeon]
MGRVGKGTTCSVKNCDATAVRSIARDKVSAAGLKVDEGRRSFLCREHYKEYKKGSKKDKLLEKWRHNG